MTFIRWSEDQSWGYDFLRKDPKSCVGYISNNLNVMGKCKQLLVSSMQLNYLAKTAMELGYECLWSTAGLPFWQKRKLTH